MKLFKSKNVTEEIKQAKREGVMEEIYNNQSVLVFRIGNGHRRIYVNKKEMTINSELYNYELKDKFFYLINFIKKECFNGVISFLHYNYSDECDYNMSLLNYILSFDKSFFKKRNSKVLYYCKKYTDKVAKYNIPESDCINTISIEAYDCTRHELEQISRLCEKALSQRGYKGVAITKKCELMYVGPTPPPPGAENRLN